MTCEDCFFARNGLCALNLDEACPTYRPDHPDGLRPPTQLRFVFRQERRRQVGWAFPTAQEQAALARVAVPFPAGVPGSLVGVAYPTPEVLSLWPLPSPSLSSPLR